MTEAYSAGCVLVLELHHTRGSGLYADVGAHCRYGCCGTAKRGEKACGRVGRFTRFGRHHGVKSSAHPHRRVYLSETQTCCAARTMLDPPRRQALCFDVTSDSPTFHAITRLQVRLREWQRTLRERRLNLPDRNGVHGALLLLGPAVAWRRSARGRGRRRRRPHTSALSRHRGATPCLRSAPLHIARRHASYAHNRRGHE